MRRFSLLAPARPGLVRRWAAAALLGPLAVAGSVVATTSTALAEVSITLDGHGNGHGVGLSQWGAYGYAVDHGWTAAQIVDHYFGNTVASTVPLDTTIRVRLQNLDGAQTATAVDTGSLVVDGLAAGSWKSVLVRETAVNGVFSVWARTDTLRCPSATGDPATSGWTMLSNSVSGNVDVRTAVDSTTVAGTATSQLISTCEPSGTVRWYRGTIRSTNDSLGANRTVNVLPVEQYLRTVIAMEMSPSWATAGGGKGAQALQAQAIAARSYALAYPAATPSYTYADLCDMVCQSYFGVAFGTAAGPTRQVENAATDLAVTATAGVVRRVTATNAIALTMFSAANGGWTATNNHPLTPFPAVQDDGDDTSLNPNHSWSVTLFGSAISAKYPAIGTFAGLTVTSRNGYGEWGGRVLSLTLTGSAGSVSVSGASFRSAMGLKDTWFNVRSASSPPAPTDCGTRVAPAAVGPLPTPAATRYTSLGPTRIVDTRTGLGTEAAPLGAGCTLTIQTKFDPVGVRALVVNITALSPSATGYLIPYACGAPRPSLAVVRATAGRVASGTATVPLGVNGTICIYSTVATPLVVDLFGGYATAGRFKYQPVTTARLYDSRPTGVKVAAGSTVRVKVVGRAGVPVGAAAAAFTLHAAGATGAPAVTVYGCTAGRPGVTSLNGVPGVDLTNQVYSTVSSTGEVCLYVGGSGAVHLTLDLSGWFGTAATTSYFVVPPARVVDTTRNIGLVGGFAAGQNRAVAMAGRGGLPAAATLRAVVATVTATGSAGTGYLTVYPCQSPVPGVSMVRYVAATVAATSVAGIDDGAGRWCIASNAAVHVVVDVTGYYA